MSAALRPEQLLERLARGRPIPAALLLGEEAYLRDLCRKHLTDALVPDAAREWGAARFSLREASLDQILARARTLPMLSPRQVVFAAELETVERWGDQRREAFIETLEAYLDDPPPFTTLVLEATKLDGRMKLGKLLAAKALTVAVALPEPPAERAALAAAMAGQMARELGIELERGAAAELAEATAGNLARMHTELEKLRDYAGQRRRITVEDVERMVQAAHTETVWQLGAALAERNPARALVLLDGVFALGEQPEMLVGGLAWMYRKLLEAQDLPRTMSAGQVAGRLRMRYETAELALVQSRRIPREQLLAGLVALHEADAQLKSNPSDKQTVLEFLVARLAAPPSA